MSLTLAPAVCRRKSCTVRAVRRGMCQRHFSEVRRAEEKARERARLKDLGEIPACGLGILRCAVCGLQLSKHTPGQSCRGGLEDLI